MKTKFALLFILLALKGFSQEEITIGQTFDFEVGDIYQYRSSLQGQPENCLTKEIKDKFYSSNNDTVFYQIYRTYYQAVVESEPEPHFVYNFGSDTIIESYTNLNSSIFNYIVNLRYDSITLNYGTDYSYDTIIGYSNTFCGILSNGFDCSFPASAVEPTYYNYRFGKGLGITKMVACDEGGAYYPNISDDLFYYSKGTESCGTMDTLTSNELNITKNNISVFPNPTQNKVHIVKDNQSPSIIELYSLSGKLLLKEMYSGNSNSIDLSKYNSGIYILKIISNDKIVTRQIIKK